LSQSALDSVLIEKRRFPPPSQFAQRAHIRTRSDYDAIRARAAADPEGFWAEQAAKLRWMRGWDRVLEWNPPWAQWFLGGQLNVSDNCLDRHLSGWRRNKAAILWEGEPGDSRVLTYHTLAYEVRRCANALKGLGVRRGDRVCLYMPMIPELAIAMLACARIGATHSVVFGGFSAEALKDRIVDAQAKLVITADGCFRRGQVVHLFANAVEALREATCVETLVVVRRVGERTELLPGRDHWWHELLAAVDDRCEPEPLDSEHPLFILYTSGTTGKPKGVVHSSGGYLTQVAMTARWIFDLQEEDTYWCTADIGWVTGHSYILYGILANGATTVMYEGAPNAPAPDRFWSIVDKYKVTVFYTAPTAIRTFIKWGESWPRRHDLSSLRLLGTVGEPINPEAWMWYHEVIGRGRCPIVDTWWQTETGAILISPIPGAVETKPGSATLPLPAIAADVVDREGRAVPPGSGGFLVIKRPWPGMLRTIYGDPERYVQQYWSEIPGCYFTGDGARQDEDGYFWLMGRVDDVLNISGHRLGSAEVESALVSHPTVAEAAVVGRPDELKGQAIIAFVTLEGGSTPSAALQQELRAHVAKEIGAMAKPEQIRFVEALPKTRSGKIMRRLLKEIASDGQVRGDTTTLEDISVLAALSKAEE